MAVASSINAPGPITVATGKAVGRRKFRPGRAVAFLVLAVFGLSWTIPFLWAVNTSLKTETDAAATPVSLLPNSGYVWQSYRQIWEAGAVPLWMINSLVVSIGVTVVTLVISTLAAYGFSRASFRGQKILLGIVVVSIMVPGQIFVVPLFDQMLSWGLVDTYGGVILPQVINPVMVFVLKRFFDEIPRELEDAARVDGANRLRVFTAVVLPLSKGIIAAVAIFVFIGAWNNFLWPFIVTNNPLLMTLPVGLQTVKAGTGYGVQFAQDMAGAVLAALPLVVVFLFFQRQIIKSVASTGFGGQ